MKKTQDFNKYLKDYEDRKLFNDDLIEKIQCIDDDFGTKTAENIRNCHNMFWSEIWKIKQNLPTNQIDQIKTRPFQTCKNKFCLLCAKLRARKILCRTYNALIEIQKTHTFIARHLTLTVKNPKVADFEISWENMNKAFHLFVNKYPELFDYVIGWQAGREVTQNEISGAKERGEFHPHIHVLLLLKPEFDKGNSHFRQTEKQILKKWNKCCNSYGLESSQIEIKTIVAKENSEFSDKFLAAICEVAKYPTAPQDIKNMSQGDFEVLYNVLFKKRLYSTGGILKTELAKQDEDLQITDLDDKFLASVFCCSFNYQGKIETEQEDIEKYKKYLEQMDVKRKLTLETKPKNRDVTNILKLCSVFRTDSVVKSRKIKVVKIPDGDILITEIEKMMLDYSNQQEQIDAFILNPDIYLLKSSDVGLKLKAEYLPFFEKLDELKIDIWSKLHRLFKSNIADCDDADCDDADCDEKEKEKKKEKKKHKIIQALFKPRLIHIKNELSKKLDNDLSLALSKDVFNFFYIDLEYIIKNQSYVYFDNLRKFVYKDFEQEFIKNYNRIRSKP